jgi:hypothetical protein
MLIYKLNTSKSYLPHIDSLDYLSIYFEITLLDALQDIQTITNLKLSVEARVIPSLHAIDSITSGLTIC